MLPTDAEMQSFAQEMYEFCPDIVEQGTESIEELVEEIKKTKSFFMVGLIITKALPFLHTRGVSITYRNAFKQYSVFPLIRTIKTSHTK